MRGFTKFALHVVPTFLVLCLICIGGQCVAQEVDVPSGRGSGSVVAPTGWAEFIAPVQQRIDLKFYGFYIGELKAPSGQFDATFRATKFLSITPSYLYYSVPADGLNELANHSGGFTNTYQEHQFRIDGTVMFSAHKFEISERNMYVRRFLPTYMYGGKSLPEKEINRYRNRIAVAYPLAVRGHIWKPFASYEAFYDQGSGWTKNRAWTGVTRDLSGTERALAELPGRRWIEVEIHLVDLGTGPTHRDWSDAFVAARLPPMRADLAARLPTGTTAPDPGELDERDELAWLYGRLARTDLPVLGPWS